MVLLEPVLAKKGQITQFNGIKKLFWKVKTEEGTRETCFDFSNKTNLADELEEFFFGI